MFINTPIDAIGHTHCHRSVGVINDHVYICLFASGVEAPSASRLAVQAAAGNSISTEPPWTILMTTPTAAPATTTTRKPPTRPNRCSLLILPTLSISQPGSMVTTTPQPLHLSLSTSQQQGEPGSCSLGTKTEENSEELCGLVQQGTLKWCKTFFTIFTCLMNTTKVCMPQDLPG